MPEIPKINVVYWKKYVYQNVGGIKLEVPRWFLRRFWKIFLFELLCINFFCLRCEFLIVTKDSCLLCFTFKGSFFTWLPLTMMRIKDLRIQEYLGSKDRPKPESFTFFKCWNPIFNWRNCSNLEICGNDRSPSEHRVGIWIIEDIIYLHFLMNNFCESLHIFSLGRFHNHDSWSTRVNPGKLIHGVFSVFQFSGHTTAWFLEYSIVDEFSRSQSVRTFPNKGELVKFDS